jgi:D-arabinose 1-dehydrogenase-like Zn-dependent alcohol dehydrogenase
MKINAYSINTPGGRAEAFSYERPIGSHDVLVKITHRSLARGDIQFIDNAWGDTRFPLVPSHEMIGIVEVAGPNVSNLRPGDRVGVGYQQEACLGCSYCAQGVEQLCASQKVIAVDCYGGLAEHIVVDSRFAFRLPGQLEAATATPLLSSGLTVYSAIRRAQLPAGSRTAVLGAGGLGHLAIQFLHRMGHGVTVFSHSPRKRALVERLGGLFADGSESAFDFILSTLNVPFDLDSFVRRLVPDGKLCLVASPLEQLSLSGGQLNNSRRSIYGSYVGSISETVEMLDFAAAHGIGAVVEVMPLDQVDEAIDKVRERQTEMGLVLEGELCR